MTSILNPKGYKHYIAYYRKGGSGVPTMLYRGGGGAGILSAKCRCGWESSKQQEIEAHEELYKQERDI